MSYSNASAARTANAREKLFPGAYFPDSFSNASSSPLHNSALVWLP